MSYPQHIIDTKKKTSRKDEIFFDPSLFLPALVFSLLFFFLLPISFFLPPTTIFPFKPNHLHPDQPRQSTHNKVVPLSPPKTDPPIRTYTHNNFPLFFLLMMSTECTSLLHSIKVIIIPQVRTDGQGNPTNNTVFFWHNLFTSPHKYQYLLCISIKFIILVNDSLYIYKNNAYNKHWISIRNHNMFCCCFFVDTSHHVWPLLNKGVLNKLDYTPSISGEMWGQREVERVVAFVYLWLQAVGLLLQAVCLWLPIVL